MDLKIETLPGSLAYYCIIGNLREALKYGREAMGRNWFTILDGEILPDDHQQADPESVYKFVETISQSQRGRKGDKTAAAQQVLKVLNAIKKGVEDFSNIDDEQPTPPETSKQPEQPVVVPVENKSDVADDLKERFLNWLMSLTKLDVVFGVTLAVADYGLTFLLHEMGVAAAVVYTMISLHALGMAKDRYAKNTARTGIAAVWLLEIGACVIHLTMFNRRIWSIIDDMPFRVEDVTTESRPFWIAVVLAILFSGAGIYAVSTTLAVVTERNEAEEIETKYGVKY